MKRLIKTFSDGSHIEYDRGSFDDWCVYIVKSNRRKPPKDVDYFSAFKRLSEKYEGDKIYKDFAVIYDKTASNVDKEVLTLIEELSKKYQSDSLEIEKLFTIVYAGMVAEENKKNTKLGKRVKRLGMHQVLVENMSPSNASEFSKGMGWRKISDECLSRGF